jgi:hypothetical protein
MGSEVIASREPRLLFVSDAVDPLFYAILKNMKVFGTKTMDYLMVVTIACSKGYGEWLAVEPLPIVNPAFLVSLGDGIHFLLIVDLRVDEDQLGLHSD